MLLSTLTNKKLIGIVLTCSLMVGCGGESSNSNNAQFTPVDSENSPNDNDNPNDTIPTVINTGCNDAITQQQMLAAINKVRTSGYQCDSGYKPPVKKLAWDGALAKASITHAREMATNNYFDHVDLEGKRSSDRMKKAGYRGQITSENIAAGNATIEGTMNNLLASDTGHCDAIMSDKYKDFAMACAYHKDAEYEYYWVQSFGLKVP